MKKKVFCTALFTTLLFANTYTAMAGQWEDNHGSMDVLPRTELGSEEMVTMKKKKR